MRRLALLATVLLFAAAPARANDTQLQRIEKARELRVCIWPEYYGITYRNPKTRLLSGLDYDLSLELGKYLGLPVRHIDSSFTQLVENLQNGSCDIAMHGVGITPARAQHMRFSQPYVRSDIFAITSKSNRAVKTWADLDQPGRVIAVQGGTVMVESIQAAMKKARVLVVVPPMSRQTEVESGRADAFITDYPYSRRMLDTTDWARVIAPPVPFQFTEYAIALPPGDNSLLDKVNAFLQQMRKDGSLRTIARKYNLEPMLIGE